MSDLNRFQGASLEEVAKRYAEELMRLNKRAGNKPPKPPMPPKPPVPKPPEPPKPPMPPKPPVPKPPEPSKPPMPPKPPVPKPPEPPKPYVSNAEYFRAAYEEMAPQEKVPEEQVIQVLTHTEPESARTMADRGQHTENHWDSGRLDAGQLNPTDRPTVPLTQTPVPESLPPADRELDAPLLTPLPDVPPSGGPDVQAEDAGTEYEKESPAAEGPPVGEAALPSKDNPSANEITDTPGDDGSERPYADTAYLKVQVSAAGRAIPIPFATVTVTREEGGQQVFHRVLETGANGQTQTIPLPAPSRELSERPGPDNPYAVYRVTVDAPEFLSQDNLRAQVFSGTVSIVPVQLIPLPDKNPEDINQASGSQD